MLTDTATKPPIDRVHLRQMTMGDAVLAREVLTLFDRQAGNLIERMAGSDAMVRVELAHALKGSARGIGAWPVADAAAMVERDGEAALGTLGAAIAQARAEIARLLKQSSAF